MAKTFQEIFLDSAETQYAAGAFPLSVIGTLNTAVNLIPVLSGNGASKSKGKYEIQRPKRLKAFDRTDSQATDGSGSYGDDFVANLNAAKKEDWETVSIQTGVKRMIAIPMELNDEFDMSDAEAYTRTISNKSKNALIELEEKAIATIIAGASEVATTLKIDGTENKELSQWLFEQVTAVELLVDDYKAGSDSVIVMIHPLVAKLFSDIKGVVYQTGPNTFADSFGGKAFVYKNITFVPNAHLNKFAPAAANSIVGAIILDTEAFTMVKPSETVQDFDTPLLDERVVGTSFYDVSGLVDPARVKVIAVPSGFTKSKKANDA